LQSAKANPLNAAHSFCFIRVSQILSSCDWLRVVATEATTTANAMS
jgi:hypothetical protein